MSERLLRGWAIELVSGWRRAGGQRRALDLSPPLQIRCFERSGKEAPVTATAIIFEHDDDQPDLACIYETISDEPVEDEDYEEVLKRTRSHYDAMRANWHPGRTGGSGVKAHHVSAGPLGRRGAFFLCIPGPVSELPVRELIEHLAPTKGAAPPNIVCDGTQPNPRHLYGIAADRERVAIQRWMTLHAPKLLASLGLPFGWWCGLFLEREHALLAQRGDGDVDVIAGPLRLLVSPEDWERRVRAEADQQPLACAPELLAELARHKASDEGLVEWPPALDYVVACEVKMSIFDGERGGPEADAARGGGWKRTHTGRSAGRIRGQLERLVEAGCDRVGFLHLAATKPSNGGGSSGFHAASRNLDLAFDSFPSVQVQHVPDGVGHFEAVMGAVGHAEEDFGGVAAVRVRAESRVLPTRDATAMWRAHLRAQLTRLARPKRLRAFIHSCLSCGRWRTERTCSESEAPCGCSG